MKFQSYGWRKSIPVADPGWIYQSRKFDTYDEAHKRAEIALQERYGISMYEYLKNTGDVFITVQTVENA